MSDIALKVSGLSKKYGSSIAVDRIDFQVGRGETLSLLGPSGCGKSTTLRMIAGLERPDEGEISIFQNVVSSASNGTFVSAEKRNVGLVFQSYAVWPHMTVEQNVGYPLALRKIPKNTITEQVEEILTIVGLAGLGRRYPTQLSGGQQQRVALARSLVYKPALLLLDEPLSNLDARLRDELRVEIKRIQRQLNLTVLYVTHDQIEALTLSDYIAVMNHGRIEQLDTPVAVYDSPQSLFVQNFVGKVILLDGVIHHVEAGSEVHLDRGPVLLLPAYQNLEKGSPVSVTIRLEDVEMAMSPSDVRQKDSLSLETRIQELRFRGNKLECVVPLGQQELVLEVDRSFNARRDQPATLLVPFEKIRIWPKHGGELANFSLDQKETGGSSSEPDLKDRGEGTEIPQKSKRSGRVPGAMRQLCSKIIGSDVLIGSGLVFLVAVLTLLPVAFIVIGSFDEAEPGEAWNWGLGAWYEVFSSESTLRAIGYSFLLTVRAPIAVLVGFFIAWLLVRVQIPGKSFIEFSLWVSYFLPSLPITMGWIILLHKDYGLLNQLVMLLPFVDKPIFDLYSVSGILWVHISLTTIPIMIILLSPALRQLDSALEQSAKVCGSRNLQTLRRILIPILSPVLLTALLAGLIRGLEAFQIELLLGIPGGIYVYATRVYDLINWDPPLFPQAMALSTLLLTFLFLLAFCYQTYSERRHYATITGRGVSFSPIQVGRWRYVASGLCIAYIAFSIFLPLCMVLLGSFMRFFGFFSIANPFTLGQWNRVFSDPAFLLALWNSLVVSFSVSALGILVYGVIAYAIVRSRLVGKRTLSLLVWLPWSVPGILLGLALLWLMLSVPVLNLLYGTLGALVLGLLIQNMPIGVQMLRTSFGQVGEELEQASAICGASSITTYRKIMLPLVAPMLVSIFVIVFISSLRDISTTIMLAGARTRPLSLLMMEFATAGFLEPAAVVGVILSAMAVGVALIARKLGLNLLSDSA